MEAWRVVVHCFFETIVLRLLKIDPQRLYEQNRLLVSVNVKLNGVGSDPL